MARIPLTTLAALTTMETRVLIALGILIVLGIFAKSYIQGFMGKPAHGTLHVPQGRNAVDVHVSNDAHLKSYKYGQVFDATVQPDEAQKQVTLLLRDKPIGVVDSPSSYVLALNKLASTHKKVLVQTVVSGFGSDGKPIVQLKLPNPSWFKRALKST